MQSKLTLDRFLRIAGILAIVVAVVCLINYLSSVLIPFFIAWAVAYLLYPIVKFVEVKMRVKSRAAAIIFTMLLVVLVIALMLYAIIPPMIEQAEALRRYIDSFVQTHTHSDSITLYMHNWLSSHRADIQLFLSEADWTEALKACLPQMWSVVTHTYNIIIGMGVVLLSMLYMFFILMDYEYLTQNWTRIFPKAYRPFWKNVSADVERAMNSYVRGQSLVALIMGILFAIGFTIIDFPLPIGMGILIGVMDLVPYLHTFALIPTAFLALIKAANTDSNFLLIFLSAFAVFCVVQVIIDMVVTPKIMGKAMGLNPAILLLSLSVWGSILGFIGLIIALPMTTILIAYYQRYVTKDKEDTPPHPEDNS